MIIDFKEIPVANKGGGQQDQFELFACSFLEAIGFEVLRRPDRGPDDKKDLILKEKRNGVGGETVINWLVSCKHFAHSGKSVSDIDELDILDRVKKHNCQGFIGFYSTIPSTSLSNKLYNLKDEIESITFDYSRIENELLRNKNCATILASFCPNSLDSYKRIEVDRNKSDELNKGTDDERLMSTVTTALILLEIDKIEEHFEKADVIEKHNVLQQLLRYNKYRNEKIADSIFDLLITVSYKTRYLGQKDITSAVKSLIFSYFPSSYYNDEATRFDNGKQCIHIGFSIVYDALIWLNDFSIASNGLLIWKFIYRQSLKLDMPKLANELLEQYDELESTLNRPGRSDLQNAKDLVRIFKNDLVTDFVGFPYDMPRHLFMLTT